MTNNKAIPLESLIVLQSQLDALPKRSPQRRALVQKVAESYGVSVSRVYRALRQNYKPQSAERQDYNIPRTTSQADMQKYSHTFSLSKKRQQPIQR